MSADAAMDRLRRVVETLAVHLAKAREMYPGQPFELHFSEEASEVLSLEVVAALAEAEPGPPAGDHEHRWRMECEICGIPGMVHLSTVPRFSTAEPTPQPASEPLCDCGHDDPHRSCGHCPCDGYDLTRQAAAAEVGLPMLSAPPATPQPSPLREALAKALLNPSIVAAITGAWPSMSTSEIEDLAGEWAEDIIRDAALQPSEPAATVPTFAVEELILLEMLLEAEADIPETSKWSGSPEHRADIGALLRKVAALRSRPVDAEPVP